MCSPINAKFSFCKRITFSISFRYHYKYLIYYLDIFKCFDKKLVEFKWSNEARKFDSTSLMTSSLSFIPKNDNAPKLIINSERKRENDIDSESLSEEKKKNKTKKAENTPP